MTAFPLNSLCYQTSIANPICLENSEEILFHRSLDGYSQIVKQNLKTGFNQGLTTEPRPAGSIGYGGASFTCRNNTVIYAGKDKRLHYLCLLSGKQFPITPKLEGVAAPSISPCEKFVIFLGEYQGFCNIYGVSIEKNNYPVKISRDPWYAFNPAFSADGNFLLWFEWDKKHMPWDETSIKIAKLHESTFAMKSHYDLINYSTQSLQKPGVCYSSPVFSPDTKFLAYTSDETGFRSLWVCPTQQVQEAKMLDTGPGEIGGPDWVPGLYGVQWHPSADSLYALHNFDCENTIKKISWPDAQVETLELPHTSIEEFHCGPKYLVYLGSSPSVPKELVSIQYENQELVARVSSSWNIISKDSLSKPKICQIGRAHV